MSLRSIVSLCHACHHPAAVILVLMAMFNGWVGALCEIQSETFRCPLRALAGRFALHALTLYIPRRGVPRNAHFGPVFFTRSRRTHCARVHCTSPPRVIFLYTSPPAVQPYLLLPSIIERFHTTCGFYNAAPARGALPLLHTHTRAPTPAAPLQVCSPASESSPFVWSSGGPLITSK